MSVKKIVISTDQDLFELQCKLYTLTSAIV